MGRGPLRSDIVADDIAVLYSKCNKLDSRVSKIEAASPFLEEMIARNVASNEKLGNTLQDIQISMVKMNEKMDEQALALTAMKAEFEETSRLTNARIDDVDKKVTQRIQQVDNRVDTIEDKGKFDITLYLKTNWPWILIVLGLGIAYVSQIIKV